MNANARPPLDPDRAALLDVLLRSACAVARGTKSTSAIVWATCRVFTAIEGGILPGPGTRNSVLDSSDPGDDDQIVKTLTEFVRAVVIREVPSDVNARL